MNEEDEDTEDSFADAWKVTLTKTRRVDYG